MNGSTARWQLLKICRVTPKDGYGLRLDKPVGRLLPVPPCENFLYISQGRPCARQQHDGHRGIGLTPWDGGAGATRGIAGAHPGHEPSENSSHTRVGTHPWTRRARSTPRPYWSRESQDAIYRLDQPGTAPTVLTGVAASPAGAGSRWCRWRR